MIITALSDREFYRLSNWVGGLLVIVVIAGLVVLDMKILPSSRGKLGLVAGIVVLGLFTGSIVILRFVRLSV